MMRKLMATVAASLAMTALVLAQGGRPASPTGTAATEIGGKYDNAAEPTYKGGKWIEITYGRPIKRGRDVLGGVGDKYGKVANPDAPVWRAGANYSTQLKTEVPLTINGKTVAPGTYTVFIDLKPNNWTLIVSRWAASPTFPGSKDALFGAFDYTPDKDVVRAPMKLATLPFSVDQLTWSFVDMSESAGGMAIMWDKVMASAAFTVAK
jgi:hypothetical protein